jgi:sec-independent protein translocase protein TatB
MWGWPVPFVTALCGQVSLHEMGMPPTIQMANLGMADSLILMVMALVVFGPRRLPQIGRQIGKLMYEFRKASNDFKFQMEEELRISEDADRRKQEEERLKALALTAPIQPALAAESVIQVADARPPSTGSELAFDELMAATGAPSERASSTDATVASTPPTASTYETGDLFGSPAPPVAWPSEPTVEETHPRIQPPSTGEQVAAARPNSLTAAEEPTAASPEQAAHHG